MAVVQHVGADFFAALDGYVQDATRAAKIASDVALESLRQDMVSSAKRHPQWSAAADSIDFWNDRKGNLVVGVQDPDKIDAALRAEFGDPEHGPAPIIRNKKAAERNAQQVLRYVWGQHMGALR